MQPKSGIHERIKFRRGFGDLISGRGQNGVQLKKNEMYFKKEKMAKDKLHYEAMKYNPLVGFKCLHYSVSEAIGTIKVHVIKKNKGDEFLVGVRTVDGTAEAGEDFEEIDEELDFDEDESELEVEVEIINDDVFEENEDFYVELYDVETGKRLKGEDTRTRITVIDDDQPGIIGFERRVLMVSPSDKYVDVKVHRLSGCDGDVSVLFETATPQGLKAAAIPGKDYEPVEGKVKFLTGETEKFIRITLLDNSDKTEKDDVF